MFCYNSSVKILIFPLFHLVDIYWILEIEVVLEIEDNFILNTIFILALWSYLTIIKIIS